jgi:hypothetical protein
MKTFDTWRHKGRRYLAVPKLDGEGFHVIDQHGGNFGAWQEVETFRALQSKGDPTGELPMPDTHALPAVKTYGGEAHAAFCRREQDERLAAMPKPASALCGTL